MSSMLDRLKNSEALLNFVILNSVRNSLISILLDCLDFFLLQCLCGVQAVATRISFRFIFEQLKFKNFHMIMRILNFLAGVYPHRGPKGHGPTTFIKGQYGKIATTYLKMIGLFILMLSEIRTPVFMDNLCYNFDTVADAG